jgi:diamine N-acetyltransferase
MKVTLADIDRSNWREALALEVRPQQQRFVATPLFSLAAALVRRWGDEYIYAPRLIFEGSTPIGFVCTVSNPDSADEYWIDDILIDVRYQGHGFGRAAMAEVLRLTVRQYPRCTAIRLSCHVANDHAARLYLSMGFRVTGQVNPESGHPEYELTGDPLRAYRR